MANNIEISQGSGTTIKTTDNGGVHTPHHIAEGSLLTAIAAGIGTPADEPWSGEGSGTVIAILKKIALDAEGGG